MDKLLKERGYKITPARMEILKIFSKTREPLDAGKVFKKIKSRKTNEVTVYRTLSDFESSGILKRVDLRKDSVFFELADDHHHHIVCTNCNTIEDFENRELEKAIKKLKSSKFKNISEHALELFGLCVNCA